MKGTYSYIQVFSLNGGYVENIFYKFVHCISKPAKFLLEKNDVTVDFRSLFKFECFNSLIAQKCIERYSREFLCMHTWIANLKIDERVLLLDARFIIICVYFSIVVGQFSLKQFE